MKETILWILCCVIFSLLEIPLIIVWQLAQKQNLEHWSNYRRSQKMRFHLSTAIVGMLSAGGVLLLWQPILKMVVYDSAGIERILFLIPIILTTLLPAYFFMLHWEFHLYLGERNKANPLPEKLLPTGSQTAFNTTMQAAESGSNAVTPQASRSERLDQRF